ncbi:hypothetical protein MBLNU457_g0409t1 [Dothideomycetes sp. NU457]
MSSSDEEDNGSFAISEDLVESRQHKAAGDSSVDFDGLLLHAPLRLHEDLKQGCGGQLWPAGMVLAKYLLRQHKNLEGRSIVELGAGGGLVGLAVALGCKTTEPIHITDQLPMLELMQTNIQLNSLNSRVQASIYDWGESVPENLPQRPDILLAADCVYFEPAFPLLLQTMSDLIGTNTVCYFCFKKRRRADLHFVKAVKKNFHVEPVDDDEDRAIYSRENLFLYVQYIAVGEVDESDFDSPLEFSQDAHHRLDSIVEPDQTPHPPMLQMVNGTKMHLPFQPMHPKRAETAPARPLTTKPQSSVAGRLRRVGSWLQQPHLHHHQQPTNPRSQTTSLPTSSRAKSKAKSNAKAESRSKAKSKSKSSKYPIQTSTSTPCTQLVLDMLNDSTGKEPTNYWWKTERVVKSEMRRCLQHTDWMEVEVFEDCDESVDELFRQRYREKTGNEFRGAGALGAELAALSLNQASIEERAADL